MKTKRAPMYLPIKPYRLLLYGCLTFLFGLISMPVFSQNLVTNGSFTAMGASWTFFAPATGTEAYNPETSYGGTVATNTIAEIDNGANLRQVSIPVVAGTNYFLSFRYTRRTIGGAPNPTNINVSVYDGTNIYLTQDMAITNSVWNWQCQVLSFTPTTNTVTLDFKNITTTLSTLGTIIDDVTITPAEQTITFTGNTCQGGNFTLNAPTSSTDNIYTNYSWTGPNGFTANTQQISFNNSTPALNGAYVCAMTLNGCLAVTGTYNLTISPSTFNITRSICQGDSYDFYGRDLFLPGQYDTLIVSNNNGCDSMIILQLNVNPRPDATIKPSGNIDACVGDQVFLNAAANNTNSTTLQWMKNGQAMTGETGTQLIVTQSGDYKLYATTNIGCTDTSLRARITFHALPIVAISVENKDKICILDTITLTGTAGGALYLWQPEAIFRDASPMATSTPVAKAVLPEKETVVKLTVYNEFGCFASDSTSIHAEPCCRIFIPSAFSPNGDGLNDAFMPYIESGQILNTLIIFDRWGHVVYKTNNVSKGWNGNYDNGKPAEIGTYMYYMRYTCTDHSLRNAKGDILLMR